MPVSSFPFEHERTPSRGSAAIGGVSSILGQMSLFSRFTSKDRIAKQKKRGD
jgi:hypothetical protein